MSFNEIYDRQGNLVGDLSGYKAIVIGAGGIGSWVALECGLIGFGTIEVYDDDILEPSNLNRTPYRWSDVDRPKVDAIEELILERRPLTVVLKHRERFTDVTKKTWTPNTFVFDCTDLMAFKNHWMSQPDEFKQSHKYCKVGYDGFSVTYDATLEDQTWGQETAYRATDSIFSAAMIIAALAVTEATSPTITGQPLCTFDIREILKDKCNG